VCEAGPVKCPLCGRAKARRACPALGRQICPACCGSKRLVEIQCPPDCGYLASSRSHPAAVVRRGQQRDAAVITSAVGDLTEPQLTALLLLADLTHAHRATAAPPLQDADVLEAAAVVAATQETADRGIIYEHRAQTIPAEQLADAYRTWIASKAGGTSQGPRDAARALRALERLVRAAATGADAPDERTAGLDLLGRLVRRFAASAGGSDAPRDEDRASRASPIILP